MKKREPSVRIISEEDEKTVHLSPYKRQYRITDESDERTVTTKNFNKIVSERKEEGWGGELDRKRIVSEREENGWGGVDDDHVFDGESSHLDEDEDIANEDLADSKVSNDDYIMKTNLSPNLNNLFDEHHRRSNDAKANNSSQPNWQAPSKPGLDNSKPIISRVAPSKSKNPPKSKPSKAIHPYSPSDSDDEQQGHFDDNDAKDWSASDIAKLSPDLQRLLGFEPSHIETDWQPPSKPGLRNSKPIVSISKSYSAALDTTKTNSFPSSGSSSIGFSNRPRLPDDADDEEEGFVDSGGKGARVWNNSKNVVNDINSFDNVIDAYNSYYQHALEAKDDHRKHPSKHNKPAVPLTFDDSIPLVPDSGRRKYTQPENSIPRTKTKSDTNNSTIQQRSQHQSHHKHQHHSHPKRDTNLPNAANHHNKAYWSTEEWNSHHMNDAEASSNHEENDHDDIEPHHADDDTDFSSMNMSPNLMAALGLPVPTNKSSPSSSTSTSKAMKSSSGPSWQPPSKPGLDNSKPIIPTVGNSAVSGTGQKYKVAPMVKTRDTPEFQPARRKSYYDAEEEEVYREGKFFAKALYGNSSSASGQGDVVHDDDSDEEVENLHFEDDDNDNDNHGDDLPSGTMSLSLMKALGLDTSKVKPVETDWQPPAASGLSNSRPISKHNHK